MAGKLKALVDSPAANKVALALCAVVWGYAYFVMKEAADSLGVFWMLAIRFAIAALVTLLIFHRQLLANLNARTIRVGLAMGFFEWAGYAFQTVGLTMTTPGKNAFITGTYVVMVPFLAWLFRMGRPHRYDVVAAVLCCAGMGFIMSDAGPELNLGDLLTIVSAFFYAMQIIEVAKNGGSLNIPALSCWQFVSMTALSAVFAVFEPAPEPSVFTPTVIGQLVFFGVVCSFAALTVMNFALTRVDPSEGSLLCSLESPFGAFFSFLAGYEVMTGEVAWGFALILVAILVSNGYPWLKSRLRRGRHGLSDV